ncbi:MAG: hypothetical protein WAK00_11930 [Microbacterium sp.]|uniref:hypothetical protein n=1 Tax=Microbacterium sp. TaxID=51671 RepID=UPI003BAE8672
MRSDFTFVDAIEAAMEQAFTDCGPRAELAGVFLPDLLTAPSFSSARTDGETILVRQAVLFQRPADDEFEVLVTLDVQIHKVEEHPGLARAGARISRQPHRHV